MGTPARRVGPREWAFREEHAVDGGVLRGFKRLPLTLSLQFVRKLSGFSVASRANEAAFERAIEQISAAAGDLMTQTQLVLGAAQ